MTQAQARDYLLMRACLGSGAFGGGERKAHLGRLVSGELQREEALRRTWLRSASRAARVAWREPRRAAGCCGERDWRG